MKINLEFEQHDLEKMIRDYFLKAGFEVQNMEELCAAFSQAFPTGLIVKAEIADAPPAPPSPPSPRVTAGPAVRLVSEDSEEPIEVVLPQEEPRLSFTDLLDPTHRGRRPEDEVQDVAEIQRLRAESERYVQKPRG
jgi:hypothetical protein